MKYTLIKSLLVILVIIFSSGCSQTAYHSLHNIAKHDCRKNPNPQERFECERAYDNADYKAYRQEYEK